MKYILFFLLFTTIAFGQTYVGGQENNWFSLSLTDCRYLLSSATGTIIVKDAVSIPVDDDIETVMEYGCGKFIPVTSKKRQGVFARNQLIAVYADFIEKVVPINNGNNCTILTKDPKVSFDVVDKYTTVSAILYCPDGGGGAYSSNNGITQDGNTFGWGGTLEIETVIDGDGNNLFFDNISGYYMDVQGSTADSYLKLSPLTAVPTQMWHRSNADNTYGALFLDGDNQSKLIAYSSNVGSSTAMFGVTYSPDNAEAVIEVFDSLDNQAHTLTVKNGIDMQTRETITLNGRKGVELPVLTATEASALVPDNNGLIIYVSSTNGTFTIVGVWAYVGGTWTKL